MVRVLLIIFLLLSSAWAQVDLGTLRSSLEKPVSRTILRAVTISLQELGERKLARWLSGIEPPSGLVGSSLDQLERSLIHHVFTQMERQGLAAAKAKMKLAFADTDQYLGLDQRLLINRGFMVSQGKSEAGSISLDPALEDLSSDVMAVSWTGVDRYVDSRLGPITGLLSVLNRDDRLILTNLSFEEFGRILPPGSRLVRLDLPLASYGKSVWMSTGKGSSRTLILADFDSRSYLIHFGLMSMRYARMHGLGLKVLTALDQSKFQSSALQLVKFAKTNPNCFENLDGLIIGYSAGFLKRWKPWITKTASETGQGGELWRVSRFKLAGGKRVAVLGGDVDFHGERLAAQLEHLVSEFPIKNVFFGGSGGSLVPAKPYSLSIPGKLVDSSRECMATNLLDGSGRPTIHASVDSPLVESPLWLIQKRLMGVETVDMELGRLSCLKSKYGVNVGAAILVTDYPIPYGSIDLELGRQNFGAKKLAKNQFVSLVESYLRSSKKSYYHLIEEDARQSLLEISQQNLVRLRNSQPPTNLREAKILLRLNQKKPRVFIRMSLGRLYHGLKNGAVYSTALVKALGFPVKPFTPELEHKVFGAWDYIFAEYSTGVGWRRYGDVVVFLKESGVLPRSFATKASGYRLTKSQQSLPPKAQRKSFTKEVFAPGHYREAVDLMSLARQRKIDYHSKQESLAEPSDQRLAAEKELDLMYMELKFRDYILIDDFHSVWIPHETETEIIEMLESHGVFYKLYNPADYPE
ncbi:hypothetical protein HOF92_00395 [bacterium]|nr:hypothetical protein [bacterium]